MIIILIITFTIMVTITTDLVNSTSMIHIRYLTTVTSLTCLSDLINSTQLSWLKTKELSAWGPDLLPLPALRQRNPGIGAPFLTSTGPWSKLLRKGLHGDHIGSLLEGLSYLSMAPLVEVLAEASRRSRRISSTRAAMYHNLSASDTCMSCMGLLPSPDR